MRKLHFYLVKNRKKQINICFLLVFLKKIIIIKEMEVCMEKNNLLFTYRKFEYTPRKSSDYRFEISKDYQCGFTFKLSDEFDNEVKD